LQTKQKVSVKKQKKIYQISFYVTIFLCLFFRIKVAKAQEKLLPQKYIVLDRYNLKRIYIKEGDAIRFSLKGDKAIFNDYIDKLNEVDSTIFLAGAKINVPLKEFSSFYFSRSWANPMSTGLGFIGGGFLLSAAVYPLMGNNVNYDPKEQAIIGASALTLGQIVRFFRVKKFRVKANRSRLRILNME